MWFGLYAYKELKKKAFKVLKEYLIVCNFVYKRANLHQTEKYPNIKGYVHIHW